MDGVLIIDKPEGPTSHDVVARARRVLRERRIGHTGTLDPMATGVLPLVLGRATRLARFLTSERKRYEAVVRLGQATDTYDCVGTPVGDAVPVIVDAAAIERALAQFRGEIVQTPPAYSAKKIGGVSAHRLARRGDAVTPAAVQVTVDALELIEVDGDRITLDVTCSAGFYVRSLAHDLGAALGCGGHLTALRRTASGDWTLADAWPLADFERAPDAAGDHLLPMSRLLPGWPAVVVTAEGDRRLRHGQLLRPQDAHAADALEYPPLALPGMEHGGKHPQLPLPQRSSQGRGSGGQGGEGEGALIRVLSREGDLLAIATRRPDALLHPGLVLV